MKLITFLLLFFSCILYAQDSNTAIISNRKDSIPISISDLEVLSKNAETVNLHLQRQMMRSLAQEITIKFDSLMYYIDVYNTKDMRSRIHKKSFIKKIFR